MQPFGVALDRGELRVAARAGLQDPAIRWSDITTAAAENVLYFALAVMFFNYMYRRSRETGQFARNEE